MEIQEHLEELKLNYLVLTPPGTSSLSVIKRPGRSGHLPPLSVTEFVITWSHRATHVFMALYLINQEGLMKRD